MKVFHIFLGLFLAFWAVINFITSGNMVWAMVAGLCLCISYSQFKKYR